MVEIQKEIHFTLKEYSKVALKVMEIDKFSLQDIFE